MGFFDKKYCDVCGEKIGILGNRKLEDGNLCKACAGKLSRWFSDRRESTLAEIKEQLADREANKEKIKVFNVSRNLAGEKEHVFIDDEKGWFAVGKTMSIEENPDILDLSQVTGCKLDVDEGRREETYWDKEKKEHVSYNPPRYDYYYNYEMIITIDSPWIKKIKFELNKYNIDAYKRTECRRMEKLGEQIVDALMGNDGYVRAQNVYTQPIEQVTNDSWRCLCGTVNTSKFCTECGQPRPIQYGNTMYRCNRCGWMPENPSNIPRFCPQCGDPFGEEDRI